jgi:hypothetical protein
MNAIEDQKGGQVKVAISEEISRSKVVGINQAA